MFRRNLCYLIGASFCLCFILAGCTVGPNYPGTPRMGISKNYEPPPDPAIVPSGVVAKEWWTFFEDPTLNLLIAEAQKNNLNLAQAAARVYEARQGVYMQQGGFFPAIGASGSVTGQENMNTATMGNANDYYSLGFDASWEIDLWGRVRRSVEAADAGLGYAKEDYNDVLITLYAEVARAYINVRTLQLQLATAEKNLDSQRESVKLTQTLFENGLATKLDLSQALRMLASSETQLPLLRISLNEQMQTIGILLGKEPGYYKELLSQAGAIPKPMETINVAVPTNIIRQRPDIRKAERALAQAVANIGVAEGELYPTLSFDGVLNFGALEIGSLFTPTHRAFSFGPSFRWSIFNGGKLQANIKMQNARALQAVYGYQSAVLNALNEVENAMYALWQYKVQYQSQKNVVANARNELDLALELYQQGLISFQNVLDAQLAVFAAENDLAGAQGQAAVNCVILYKALGGGWDPYNPPEIPNLNNEIKEINKTGTLNNERRINPSLQR